MDPDWVKLENPLMEGWNVNQEKESLRRKPSTRLLDYSLCLLTALALTLLFFPSLGFAQSGAGVFKDNCANIGALLSGDFGAMLTAITGALAILASVMGSFKGAWALLFVSVGCFIFEGLLELLFPGMC